MQQLSPYAALQNEVNRIASQVAEPLIEKFGPFFVEATIVLSAYGDQNQATNTTYCTYALLSLDEGERQNYLSSFEVSGRVFQQMAAPEPWPYEEEPEPEPDAEPEPQD